jgi:hypothetical protein
MKLSSTLSWADKLVLVSRYELSETEACTAFGVTKQELVVAKNLLAKGVFAPNETLNTSIYSDFFVKLRSGELDHLQKTFKPKGARPSKITMAFEAITDSPQKVSEIIERYGVSLAVLRQSKRFDKGNVGQIHIRKDKDTSELMVWRDKQD